jgi:hypothetical protein
MRDKVYVLSHGTKWKVKCEHCNAGSNEAITDTQAQAIVIAKQHVGSLSQGTLSQILVQGQDGQWRTEWTYGKDPYPPTG